MPMTHKYISEPSKPFGVLVIVDILEELRHPFRTFLTLGRGIGAKTWHHKAATCMETTWNFWIWNSPFEIDRPEVHICMYFLCQSRSKWFGDPINQQNNLGEIWGVSIPALKSYTFFFTIRFPIKGNFGTCFQLRLMHQLIDAFTADQIFMWSKDRSCRRWQAIHPSI